MNAQLLNREDFQQNLGRVHRMGIPFIILYMGGFLGMITVEIFIMTRFDPQSLGWLQRFAMISGFLAALFLYLWAGFHMGKRVISSHGLLCPGCKSPLTGSYAEHVLETGRCEQCGRTILLSD